MFVSKDKKTAINEDHVGTAHITANDSLVLSVGANAVTLDGDDAVTVAKDFGLTTHAEDAAAEAKKEKHDAANQAQGQQHPQSQPAKK